MRSGPGSGLHYFFPYLQPCKQDNLHHGGGSAVLLSLTWFKIATCTPSSPQLPELPAGISWSWKCGRATRGPWHLIKELQQRWDLALCLFWGLLSCWGSRGECEQGCEPAAGSGSACAHVSLQCSCPFSALQRNEMFHWPSLFTPREQQFGCDCESLLAPFLHKLQSQGERSALRFPLFCVALWFCSFF